VIHFATHGLVSSQRPLRSALLLSDEPDGSQDGFLEVREIYELHLASELIVLSACRGARGRVLRGEGVEGLGQAFLHAGARSVVASVLDIADDRAVQLMELFYGGLADGLSTGAALRAAKLAMLRERRIPARAWAGFAVIGDPSAEIALSRPPEPASRALWGAALIAALLLSVAIGSRYLRPRR
jgi:CHAT domain-containing protein